MFGIGLGELLVIGVVGLLVFGPDRLPEFARQAGRIVRQLRNLANTAQSQLRDELGPEYADLKLTDLDPRQAIRRHILEAMDDEDDDEDERHTRSRTAREVGTDSAPPPYDLEAT